MIDGKSSGCIDRIYLFGVTYFVIISAVNLYCNFRV